MHGFCFFGVGCCSAGGILHNCLAAATLEFAAAPLEEASVCLATASPLESFATLVWLLFLWSPLLYRGLLPGGFLHNCVAAAPLESAALQGAARWRLPPKLSVCFSIGIRCSNMRLLHLRWLHVGQLQVLFCNPGCAVFLLTKRRRCQDGFPGFFRRCHDILSA